MEEKEKQASVPYFIHEGQMARMERSNKRLTFTIIAVLAVALIMFVINNAIWMRYASKQVEEARAEVQDARVYEQPDQGVDR